MKFLIMNFDEPIAEFVTEKDDIGEVLIISSKVYKASMEINVQDWVQKRKPVKNRSFLEKLLSACGISNVEDYFLMTYGLSLNDALWVKPFEKNLLWKDVNLYDNSFNEVLSKLAFNGEGLQGIQIQTTSPEYTTTGMLAKCWRRINNGIFLYKTGTEGTRNAGKEPYSEVLATQVCRAMELSDYVPYTLSKYENKLVSICKLFTSAEVGYSSYASRYRSNSYREIKEIMMKSEYKKSFSEMTILDSLILNTDRHLNNFGFSINNRDNSIIKMAPIFDNGLGFTPYYDGSETDFKYYEKYMDTLSNPFGLDFVLIARSSLTKELRAKLINLKQFELEPIPEFSDSRLKLMNHMLQTQIKKILDTKETYVKKPEIEKPLNRYELLCREGYLLEDIAAAEPDLILEIDNLPREFIDEVLKQFPEYKQKLVLKHLKHLITKEAN